MSLCSVARGGGSNNIKLLKYRYIPNAAIQGRRHVLTWQGASLSDVFSVQQYEDCRLISFARETHEMIFRFLACEKRHSASGFRAE